MIPKHRQITIAICVLIVVILGFNTPLFAGNTGKIAGVVNDKQTGEPLAGANVLLDGTHFGASTDGDGIYYIIGVPPGEYTLQCVYIGYHTLTIKEALVKVDRTTKIDIELESEIYETETVEVFAKREIIQKDVTSTSRVTTAEDIVVTPGIESVSDVVGLMPGVTLDLRPQRLQLADGSNLQVRDESLKNIHVRGGRGGEILFMVDGIPVNHPIYGGRAVLDLNVEDVQQIELLTGGFNAEYGQAQSGVVNITTRSGSFKFTGGLQAKTDITGGLGYSQDEDYISFNSGGTIRLINKIGIGNFFYFASGNASRTNTAFNNYRDRDKLDVFGLFDIEKRQNNTGNFNTKLKWELNPQLDFTLSYHGSLNDWSSFDWRFQNFPNNIAEYKRHTHNLNLRYHHVFSKSTFYNLNFGYLDVFYRGSIDGESSPDQFWTINEDTLYTSANPPQINQATKLFDDTGFQAIWRDDRTKSFIMKTDLTSQIHRAHLVKIGASMQYHDLKYIDLHDAAYKLSNYGEYLYGEGLETSPPPGPYPEFGQTRWSFSTTPVIGDLFIQDKFELESLILNIGARVDWVYLGNQVNSDAYKERWKLATGIPTEWDLLKTVISPRFGVSFPVSEKMKLFFSYGHFNQLPELQFYYRDPWSGGLTGNPHLEFENTILFEFGLTRQLGDFWSVDAKAYGKDISETVGTEGLQAASGVPVSLYVNNGFGRARGLELELRKAYSGFTQMNLSYTLQWAKGFSSSAFEGFIRQQNNLARPIRESPLDWDVRNQVILNLTFISVPGRHPNLFGFKMPDNWNITVLTRFNSGEAFTPGTLDPLESRVKKNTEHKPYMISTDLKINKGINTGFGSIELFLDIFSLFNIRSDVEVNNWTGKAMKYGDLRAGTQEIYSWRDMYAILTPQWWTPPRYMQLGVRYTF